MESEYSIASDCDKILTVHLKMFSGFQVAFSDELNPLP